MKIEYANGAKYRGQSLLDPTKIITGIWAPWAACGSVIILGI